ncbi:MAG: YceI family protein [Pararhodobacter sp.]
MKLRPALVLSAVLLATPALSAETHVLDPSHSQIVFSNDHLGISTSYGMFSGFVGEIRFDDIRTKGPPGAVEVEIGIASLQLGSLTTQALAAEFLDAESHATARFTAEILRADAGCLAERSVGFGVDVDVTLSARRDG